MAGDWIKMRVLISRDPKVISMADYLAFERGVMDWLTDPVRQRCKESAYEYIACQHLVSIIVSKLLLTWGVASDRGKPAGNDLVLSNASLQTVDEIADMPCFGEAMASVGWASEDEGDGGRTVVRFVNYLVENSCAEDRRRMKNAEYKRKSRASSASVSASCQHDNVLTVSTMSAPREEKIREDKKNTPLPPNLDTPAFREAWTEWQAYRREIKKTMTPRTERTQLKELASWGPDRAIKAITRSIAAGWTGIHEGNGNGTHRVGRDPSRVEAPTGKYDGIAKQAFGDPPPEPGAPATASDGDPAASLFGPGCGVGSDPADF